jgi:hypothetical protein
MPSVAGANPQTTSPRPLDARPRGHVGAPRGRPRRATLPGPQAFAGGYAFSSRGRPPDRLAEAPRIPLANRLAPGALARVAPHVARGLVPRGWSPVAGPGTPRGDAARATGSPTIGDPTTASPQRRSVSFGGSERGRCLTSPLRRGAGQALAPGARARSAWRRGKSTRTSGHSRATIDNTWTAW